MITTKMPKDNPSNTGLLFWLMSELSPTDMELYVVEASETTGGKGHTLCW